MYSLLTLCIRFERDPKQSDFHAENIFDITVHINAD